MKKRFLVGLTTLALAAGVTFGLGHSASTAAAAAAAPASSMAQRGPGVNDGTHAGGVVASVSGTTINVTGRDGAIQAIQTTTTTTFTLDGSASSLSAVAAGQFVHADGTTDSSGAFTATAVKVSTSAPQGRGGRGGPGVTDGTHAGGVVASVSGTTISVTGRDGAIQAIQTTTTTTFTLDGSASSLSAVAAGQFVHADGTTDSSGAFTATAVKVSTSAPQGRGGPRP